MSARSSPRGSPSSSAGDHSSSQHFNVVADPALLKAYSALAYTDEVDDALHDAGPPAKRFGADRRIMEPADFKGRSTWASSRGILNMGAVVILGLGLIMLFGGLPVYTAFSKASLSNFGASGLGGTNSTGQVSLAALLGVHFLPPLARSSLTLVLLALFTGSRYSQLPRSHRQRHARQRAHEDRLRREGWFWLHSIRIDSRSPADVSLDLQAYQLVFSDEFEQDGRLFSPGEKALHRPSSAKLSRFLRPRLTRFYPPSRQVWIPTLKPWIFTTGQCSRCRDGRCAEL
jgi:hypothetical protein